MTEHDYCRACLKEVMWRVKRRFSSKTIKAAWGYKYSDEKIAEFHVNKCAEVPDGFYWSGRACCIWMARALGWTAFLKNRKDKNES